MTAGSVAVPTIIPLKAPQGPKHVIDSATLIELRSETSGCVVLYAVDGSRPEAAFRQGRLHIPKTTHLYREPFLLSPGKVFVRALAMLNDASKQSSVVTKRFTVYEANEADNDESEEEEMPLPQSPSPLPSISSQLKHRLSMSSRVSLASTAIPEPDPPSSPAPRPSRCASAKSLANSVISRPTTAEKPQPCCVYCKAPRPKTSGYKYCTHCGSRLPPLPLVDPRPPLQMGVCSRCRAQLPPDTSTCLVCEGVVQKPPSLPPIHGQATSLSPAKEKSLCLSCGTANLPHLSHCVTCEKPVFPEPEEDPPPPAHTPPPLPTPAIMRPVSGSSYMMCGVCGRVNVSDARFCDWCGSKPEGCQLSVMCAGCSSANEWHYRHCFNCGGLIKAPLRPEVELAPTMKMPAIAERDKNAWIPVVEIEDKGPELKTQGTQTAGIFYPSSRTLNKAQESQHIKRAVHVQSRDRLPLLQDYSPGRGLWRMQLQHVCSHFRAHAQSSTELQADIGHPQLGKLVTATAKEHGSQFSFKLTFDLRPPDSSRPSSTTSLHSISTTSLPSPAHKATPTKQSTNNSGRKKHTKPKSPVRKRKGDVERLLGELSISGQGRKEVVKELLGKGVDANSTDSSGLPLLSLAAGNGHLDCVGVLVEGGASVNAQHKTTGNTALHQAVLGGPARVDCVEALLGYSANPRLKNKQGVNPCELAIQLNYDGLVTCFATYVGAGLLDKLAKSQINLTI